MSPAKHAAGVASGGVGCAILLLELVVLWCIVCSVTSCCSGRPSKACENGFSKVTCKSGTIRHEILCAIARRAHYQSRDVAFAMAGIEL